MTQAYYTMCVACGAMRTSTSAAELTKFMFGHGLDHKEHAMIVWLVKDNKL